MDQKLAYELLGIQGIATKEQVKKAYYCRCKQLHPDDNPTKQAADLYIQVQEAYQWIMKWNAYSSNEKIGTCSNRTGKVIGGWPVSQPKYSYFQERKRQVNRMEQEQKKSRRREDERKQKIADAMQKNRKLPSEREAEKRRRIAEEQEARRIADIIKKLWELDSERRG